MKLTIQREALLKPLQMVCGVVEKKHQTKPILSNVYLEALDDRLILLGTDTEIELRTHVFVDFVEKKGKTTVLARKFLDIIRSLPKQAMISIQLDNHYLTIKTEETRFNLVTLSAETFPHFNAPVFEKQVNISRQDIAYLLGKVYFSMAQNDVRYCLNGLCLTFEQDRIRSMASDGHRLAMACLPSSAPFVANLVLPRRAVLEIQRLLESENADNEWILSFTDHHIQLASSSFCFHAKLIDSIYPDYRKLVPVGGNHVFMINRDLIRDVLAQVSIMSHDKHPAVRLSLTNNQLTLAANNPELEEAEADLPIHYHGESLTMGFNANYLKDVCMNIPEGDMKLTFKGIKDSVLIESLGDNHVLYVVMPMRL